jgi:hypothetical protein
MHPGYHESIVSDALAALRLRATAEQWTDVEVDREGDHVYVRLTGRGPGDMYLAKIDCTRYPVEPYELGFIRPASARADYGRVSERDPRYWPWSPMPGQHGSFLLTHGGAIRVFWCRPCTASYFYYHGMEQHARWRPVAWPLHHVVDTLRQSVRLAEHPRHWRSIQRQTLLAAIQGSQVMLPADGCAHVLIFHSN